MTELQLSIALAFFVLFTYRTSSWRIKRIYDVRRQELCPHPAEAIRPGKRKRWCSLCKADLLWGWECPPG